MSARASARPGKRPTAQTRGRSRTRRRRLAALAGVAIAAAAVLAAVMSPLLDRAVQEIRLPLRHEDIIRQQAAEKGLDPAMIAAVIYTESRFRDQTSAAGAKGLMQILPTTADYIARLSGGTAFEQGDLAKPQINISYGSFYLDYLLGRYDGNEVLALAAYNAGEGKVDEWLSAAGGVDGTFDLDRHIPFEETRVYVNRVLGARARYREQYPRELGLRRRPG